MARLRAAIQAALVYPSAARDAGFQGHAQGWLQGTSDDGDYRLTSEGAIALETLGIDVDALRSSRRRFACACLDWSERRPHLGGALGAAWGLPWLLAIQRARSARRCRPRCKPR